MAIKLKIGQKVKYTNGNLGIYEGEIVWINGRQLIVIGDSDEMILWKMGYAVGASIVESQIIEIV